MPRQPRCQRRAEDLLLRKLVLLFFDSHKVRTRALLQVAMKLDLAVHGVDVWSAHGFRLLLLISFCEATWTAGTVCVLEVASLYGEC